MSVPRLSILLLAFGSLILLSSEGFSQADKKAKPKFTNRLAKETSPYLLMHAHNPTDWFPWGAEAFAKAKKEGKLVFLSIGYSSCYWCHVMERESFASEAVAKILNDHFVCIKVDREERPEIDAIYMEALRLVQRGGGGWPLSMFLTADAKPIVGFTYRQPEDKEVDGQKLIGFKTILKTIHEAYQKNAKDIEKQGEELANATAAALDNIRGIALVDLNRELVGEIVDTVKSEFDSQYGGFGSPERKFRGPKFPLPPRLDLLLHVGQRTKDKELIDMVQFTLEKMARGGIYDQLGGGFHRYSTERTWTVPHFEKMLYDNAQLVEVGARAYRATQRPLFRRFVEETLTYVEREMMSPEGAFYSSQDAETHHEEGRFYVWTDKEFDEALPDKADNKFMRKIFGMESKPNFEDKYYILTVPKPLPEVAEELKISQEQLRDRFLRLRQKLFEVRERRDKPLRNEIALTAWSGLMIAGFAEAGQALEEPKYIKTAARAADFVLKNQKTADGRLLRTYGAAPGQKPKAAVNAYLEDYSFLVHSLLNLHEATKDKRWLDESRTLTDTMLKHHGDKKAGGYYFTAHDHEKLFARTKDQHDGPTPSGNSLAARNLVRLWAKTGEARYGAEAERTFKAFAASLKAYPSSLAAMAQALDMYLDLQERKNRKAPEKK